MRTPANQLAQQREYYRQKMQDPAYVERRRRRARENYHKNKTAEKTKDRNLRKKYGIGLSDYLHMLDEQDGKCFVCGEPGDPLHVDHCHATGAVRKLLCACCNTALGMLRECPDRARKLINYMEKQ